MIEPDKMSPTGYAKKLAKYIKDPSTIRARTIEEYGESPSIDEIRKMQHHAAPSPKIDFTTDADNPVGPIVSNIISPREIIRNIAAIFDMTYDDIVGIQRNNHVLPVRHLIATLLVARGNSRGRVGEWLGGRDHTTIINSLYRFKKIRKTNPYIDKVYREHLTAWNIPIPD